MHTATLTLKSQPVNPNMIINQIQPCMFNPQILQDEAPDRQGVRRATTLVCETPYTARLYGCIVLLEERTALNYYYSAI